MAWPFHGHDPDGYAARQTPDQDLTRIVEGRKPVPLVAGVQQAAAASFESAGPIFERHPGRGLIAYGHGNEDFFGRL